MPKPRNTKKLITPKTIPATSKELKYLDGIKLRNPKNRKELPQGSPISPNIVQSTTKKNKLPTNDEKAQKQDIYCSVCGKYLLTINPDAPTTYLDCCIECLDKRFKPGTIHLRKLSAPMRNDILIQINHEKNRKFEKYLFNIAIRQAQGKRLTKKQTATLKHLETYYEIYNDENNI